MTYLTREGMQSLWTSLFIYPDSVTVRDCPIDLHLFQYSVGDLVPTFGAPATVRAELRHTNISRPLPQSRGDRFQLLPNVTWQACAPPQVQCLSVNKPTIDVSIGYGFHGLNDYCPRLVVAQAVADEPLWLLITWHGYFTSTYAGVHNDRSS